MSSKTVSLALHGGGAHGAFTWGVLDRLLDQRDLVLDGISGTSAGAINGCLLAQGLSHGRARAKQELARFWRRISEVGMAAFSPYQATPYHSLLRSWNLDWSPAGAWLDAMALFVSPYQLNPLDRNPLRELLDECLDFAQLTAPEVPRLFVGATNLKTNKMKVFRNAELCPEALLASGCLPQLHRAVEVGGEFYWDGGFTGNPVLSPLIRECEARDLILVQVSPTRREQLPISARDIADRLNEVAMNAALMRELDVIAMITRLVEEGTIQHPRYKAIRLHQIADPAVMAGLGQRSKHNTAWAFLTYLRDAGRACAAQWLADNQDRIGRESTLDPAEFAV
jgi:NTE family protein